MNMLTYEICARRISDLDPKNGRSASVVAGRVEAGWSGAWPSYTAGEEDLGSLATGRGLSTKNSQLLLNHHECEIILAVAFVVRWEGCVVNHG